MRQLVLSVFLTFVSSIPVFGSSSAALDGNEILRRCSPGLEKTDLTAMENAEYIYCMGYIAGVMDAAVFMHTMSDEKNTVWRWCGPADGIAGGQAARIVVKWLKNNPEKLHLRGDTLIIAALHEAFPCH